MADAGLIVLVSFISPFAAERSMARDLFADGEFVEVREGLKLGEQVVTAGKTALREGSSVQVINPAGAARPVANAAAQAAAKP